MDQKTTIESILKRMEERIQKLEQQLEHSSSEKKTQYTINVEKIDVYDPVIEELSFQLDNIDVKELSGAMNIGNNFGTEAKPKGESKKKQKQQKSSEKESDPNKSHQKKSSQPQEESNNGEQKKNPQYQPERKNSDHYKSSTTNPTHEKKDNKQHPDLERTIAMAEEKRKQLRKNKKTKPRHQKMKRGFSISLNQEKERL